MTDLAVPATMGDVTAEWLTDALRAGGVLERARVLTIEKETIGAGVGVLGELARVTPTYDVREPGAPATLVAKIPTSDPGGRAVANMLGYYEREIRFYREIASRCSLASPRCYYSDMNPAAVQYIVLMEDLGRLPIGNQLAGCSVEEAELIIGGLAQHHADWWESDALAAIEWMPRADSPMLKLAQGAYLGALPAFLQKFGDLFTAAQRSVAEALGPRMNLMQDAFATAPLTMLHADPRLDNIFFGSSDGRRPLTLIDWQILVKGRGPYDIAYFLSQSVDPAERKANEERLLRGYHERLSSNGVTGYSWEQCWDDYRASTLFCLAYPVVAGGAIEPANDRGVALVRAMATRSITAITELRADELLERFAVG